MEDKVIDENERGEIIVHLTVAFDLATAHMFFEMKEKHHVIFKVGLIEHRYTTLPTM